MTALFAQYEPNDPERIRALIRYAERNLALSRNIDEQFVIINQINTYKIELEELLISLKPKRSKNVNR